MVFEGTAVCVNPPFQIFLPRSDCTPPYKGELTHYNSRDVERGIHTSLLLTALACDQLTKRIIAFQCLEKIAEIFLYSFYLFGR